MAPYIDRSLSGRLNTARAEAQLAVDRAWVRASTELYEEAERLAAEARDAIAGHADRIAELVSQALSELGPFAERAEQLRTEAERLTAELDIELPDRPEPTAANPNGRPLLFDSRRHWLEQLKVFKARQGGGEP
jgi:hypothetical protein